MCSKLGLYFVHILAINRKFQAETNYGETQKVTENDFLLTFRSSFEIKNWLKFTKKQHFFEEAK